MYEHCWKQEGDQPHRLVRPKNAAWRRRMRTPEGTAVRLLRGPPSLGSSSLRGRRSVVAGPEVSRWGAEKRSLGRTLLQIRPYVFPVSRSWTNRTDDMREGFPSSERRRGPGADCRDLGPVSRLSPGGRPAPALRAAPCRVAARPAICAEGPARVGIEFARDGEADRFSRACLRSAHAASSRRALALDSVWSNSLLP